MFKTLKFYFYHFMFEWHAAEARKNYERHTHHFEKVEGYYEKMKTVAPKFGEES